MLFHTLRVFETPRARSEKPTTTATENHGNDSINKARLPQIRKRGQKPNRDREVAVGGLSRRTVTTITPLTNVDWTSHFFTAFKSHRMCIITSKKKTFYVSKIIP